MMKIAGIACLSLLWGAVTLPADEDKDDGFKPLFAGTTLGGWTALTERDAPVPADEWTWKGDVLVAKKGTSWLKSKEQYGDFILELEFRVPVNGNSGVFLRVPDLKEKEYPWTHGMEI